MESGKLYYSIGEVAQMFDVNASLIRFWEKEFKSLHPQKNIKGNRKFTSKDISEIKKIYELVKVQGFTLDGAKKALKSGDPIESKPTNGTIIKKLEFIRSKLLELKQ